MKRLFVALAALLAAGIASAQQAAAPAPDFEYHGYMRSGIGFSQGGTDQVCYRAPGTEGASGKFRLGNECDTYVEAEFVKSFLLGKTASDPIFKTHFRLAATSAGHRDWEPTNAEFKEWDSTDPNTKEPVLGQEFVLALREAYAEATNVLGSARPWVGKRFYRRHDIHILDYYLINNSGPGAGVEGIDLGAGQLHLAMTRNIPAGDDDGPAQTNTDIRFSDLKLGGAGTLETIVIYGQASGRGHETGEELWEAIDGTQLNLVHSMDVLGGFNRLTAQFGRGIFGATPNRASALTEYGAWGTQSIVKGADEELDARKKSSTLRLADELLAQFGSAFATSFVLLYQDVDVGGLEDANGEEIPNKTETTAGLRPVYSFTQATSLAVEYGYTSVKNGIALPDGYADSVLHKLTVAPQVSAGTSFWARPQLRLFVTYAKWNEDSKGLVGTNTKGQGIYADDTSGFSTGAQLEAWW